jgi:hypothetical protein
MTRLAHEMLRLVCVAAGAVLLWSGVTLARQEGELTAARFAARDGRPGALRAKGANLERAYLAFANARDSRGDLAEPELDLAVELDRAGLPGGFLGGAEREGRIKAAAQRLARSSPVAANAWCTLALVESRTREGSQSFIARALDACYRLGPRDITLVEPRLYLSLALWDTLPKAARTKALVDVAAALQDLYRDWMVDRLAYGAAVIAPARSELISTFISPYGDAVERRFSEQLMGYRKRFAAAPAIRPVP